MKTANKGVSEVVGVTLIVALAVVLATAFVIWGSGALSQETDKGKSLFDRGIKNIYADIDITAVTWYSANSTIYVKLENTGGIDLTKVNVFAGKQIKYYDTLIPGQIVEISAVLGAKPDKVAVESAEGGRDEQNV